MRASACPALHQSFAAEQFLWKKKSKSIKSPTNAVCCSGSIRRQQRSGGGRPKKSDHCDYFLKITTAVLIREGFLVFVEIGKSGDAVQGANMLSYVRGFYIIC